MASAPIHVVQAAKGKVMGPAIGLILTGVLTLGLVVWGIVQNAAAGGGDFDTKWAEEIKKIENDPNQQADQKKATIDFMNKIHDVVKPLADFSVVFQIGAVAIGILSIIGGVRVMALKNRGLGITSSILSMLPCVSCCCLGIPFGIWMLIVLSNDVVKRGFAAVADGGVGRSEADLDPGFER